MNRSGDLDMAPKGVAYNTICKGHANGFKYFTADTRLNLCPPMPLIGRLWHDRGGRLSPYMAANRRAMRSHNFRANLVPFFGGTLCRPASH